MALFSLIVFWLSLAAILYIIAGYPILLAIVARRYPKPVAKDGKLRTVAFVIAVRNGQLFLEGKLRSILSLIYPRELIEITVISDGSTDKTDDIARSFAGEGVAFHRIERAGKSAAVNLGIESSTAEIVVLTDVRQTLDQYALRNLVGCFGDPTVGAVSGELAIRPGHSREEADIGLYWRYEVFIRKQMSSIDSTFGANGPFYAIRRSLAVPIPPDTLLDDVYLPLAAFFQGYRLILEQTAKAFDYPTNLKSEFKRKVRTQAGLYQILKQYPQLLTSQNRMRLHFLSGKFGRLLVPFFLILIALSTFGLPRPLYQVVLFGQIAFYVLALIDRWLPQGFFLKRLSSPIRTFMVLMAAAFMAIQVFFVPPRKLWKETKVRII